MIVLVLHISPPITCYRNANIVLYGPTVDTLSHRLMLRQYSSSSAPHPHTSRHIMHHMVTKVLYPPK
jgi:hypothetical protein